MPVQRLFLLRIILLSSGLATIFFAYFVFDTAFFLTPILITFSLLFAISVRTAYSLKKPGAIQERELFVHLVIDVIGLSVIFYYAAGPNNPFTALYLVPVCVAAITLPKPQTTWGITILTVICYSLTVFALEQPDGIHQHDAQAMDLHVIGMWLGLSLCACVIASFAVNMDRLRRQRDKILTDSQEQAFRDQRLIELGTLAAGAAHELGTPLATMSVIAGEMAHHFADNATIVSHAQLLSSQLQRCKESLQVMSANAGLSTAESGGSTPLDDYIAHLFDSWQALRTDINVKFTTTAHCQAPNIVTDLTLSQALTNIFNNAADVSPDDVTIDAQWDQTQLQLYVYDRGPGFTIDDAGKLGKTLFTTKMKGDGLGIGIFLSYATINRLGGDVQVTARTDGTGTCTWISLPLTNLRIDSSGEQYATQQ